MPDRIASARTLDYRNEKQYSGPLTPMPELRERGMDLYVDVVRDGALTAGQRARREGVWGRLRGGRGRVVVVEDEESVFARGLGRWTEVGVGEEEELRARQRVKDGCSRFSEDSEASEEKSQWPRSRRDTVVGQLRRMRELNRPDARFEMTHPDKFELETVERDIPGVVGSDGFETQAVSRPAGPMPREIAQRSASFSAPPPLEQRDIHRTYSTTAKDAGVGRSLTHPRRETSRKLVENSKFAEQI